MVLLACAKAVFFRGEKMYIFGGKTESFGACSILEQPLKLHIQPSSKFHGHVEQEFGKMLF